MAATAGPLPTTSAISSTHSMLISVESMSKAIRRKRASGTGGVKPWTVRPGANSNEVMEGGDEPASYRRSDSASDQVASHCGRNATKMAASMPVTKASPQAVSQWATSDRLGPTPGSA